MKNWLTDNSGRYRAELLIMAFSLLCWWRILGMSGIWWDDWAWVWHYFGSENINEFMQPFNWLKHRTVGYMLYANITLLDLFRENASNIWSICRFMVFTVNALLIYKISNKVLRENMVMPLALAIIYSSSPVVDHLALVTFNYHFFLFCWLFSILLSVKAIAGNKIRPGCYLASISFCFLAMVSLESFILFDILRPILFVYVILGKNGGNVKDAVRKSLLYWAPFILIGSVVILDTILVPQTGPYAGVYSAGSFSVEFLVKFIGRYLFSIVYVFIWVYGLTIKFFFTQKPEIIFVITSAALAVLSYFVILKRLDRKNSSTASKEAKYVAIFGLIALIVGLFPYALTRGAVNYGDNSRHGLLAAIGASIFLPSFILSLYYRKKIALKPCAALIGLLVFLGALQCSHNVGVYKSNWEHQRSIWWQMIWRAPDIKANTFMIIDMPWKEAPGSGSYVLPPALNLAYAKSLNQSEVFSHHAYELRNAFRTDETNYRAVAGEDVVEFQSFRGTLRFYPKNLIAASYQNGYLYVNDEIAPPVSSDWEDVAFMLANAANDRIIYEEPAGAFPFRWILGPELSHDWRYYYQRANALTGRNDNAGIIALYNEALATGYDLDAILPQNLMPFIKAFYLSGKFEKANELLMKWAGSPAGNSTRAHRLLESEYIKNNPAIYEKVLGTVKNIFK